MDMLTNHSFTVRTSDVQCSRHKRMRKGVPQGAVLAPMMFNIFIYSNIPSVLQGWWSGHHDEQNKFGGSLIGQVLLHLSVGKINREKWKELKIFVHKKHIFDKCHSTSVYDTKVSASTLLIWRWLWCVRQCTAGFYMFSAAEHFFKVWHRTQKSSWPETTVLQPSVAVGPLSYIPPTSNSEGRRGFTSLQWTLLNRLRIWVGHFTAFMWNWG